MKRAFIVCGPEHSGNRLVAGLLASAGCWGAGSTEQPTPKTIPSFRDVDMVVIAHLRMDLEGWVKHFRHKQEVHFVLTARDPWVQVRSRSKAAGCSHSASMDRYGFDYRAAFRVIAKNSQHSFTVITYESLLWDGAANRFLSLFGLEQKHPLRVDGEVTEIRDENGKWYAGD